MCAYKKDLSQLVPANMTNTSYYWLGFLLADGHFHTIKKAVELSVEVSKKDLGHIQKLLIFLGRGPETFTQRTRQTQLCSHAQTHVSFRLSDDTILPKLITYFDISHNKTLNPPILTNYISLSLENKYSLLIGFIDGDGFVRAKGGAREGKIEGHINWKPIYEFFNSFLMAGKVSDVIRGDRPNRKAVMLYLSSSDIKMLYEFAVKEVLPILARKWDPIKESFLFVKQPMTDKTKLLKEQIRKLHKTKQQGQIAKELNISIGNVKYIYRLIKADEVELLGFRNKDDM